MGLSAMSYPAHAAAAAAAASSSTPYMDPSFSASSAHSSAAVAAAAAAQVSTVIILTKIGIVPHLQACRKKLVKWKKYAFLWYLTALIWRDSYSILLIVCEFQTITKFVRTTTVFWMYLVCSITWSLSETSYEIFTTTTFVVDGVPSQVARKLSNYVSKSN